MWRLNRLCQVACLYTARPVLQALPRDDAGPPSELGQRRQKFAQFEGHCSEVRRSYLLVNAGLRFSVTAGALRTAAF